MPEGRDVPTRSPSGGTERRASSAEATAPEAVGPQAIGAGFPSAMPTREGLAASLSEDQVRTIADEMERLGIAPSSLMARLEDRKRLPETTPPVVAVQVHRQPTAIAPPVSPLPTDLWPEDRRFDHLEKMFTLAQADVNLIDVPHTSPSLIASFCQKIGDLGIINGTFVPTIQGAVRLGLLQDPLQDERENIRKFLKDQIKDEKYYKYCMPESDADTLAGHIATESTDADIRWLERVRTGELKFSKNEVETDFKPRVARIKGDARKSAKAKEKTKEGKEAVDKVWDDYDTYRNRREKAEEVKKDEKKKKPLEDIEAAVVAKKDEIAKLKEEKDIEKGKAELHNLLVDLGKALGKGLGGKDLGLPKE